MTWPPNTPKPEAVLKYEDFTDVPLTHYLPDITLRSCADAALAAYEEVIERLCVCGTCGEFDSFGSATYCAIECPERIHAYDHERHYSCECQYVPSRWTPYWGAEQEEP